MTKGIEKENLLRSVGETEMGDLRVVGILWLDNFINDKRTF